ncbi:MAG: hypothetical protein FJZ56_05995 [Chlamydiae bacterium]|nr:hypothetical protein [Chlamydiota bacterium]
MKYLFTFAFKTVQATLVHLKNISEALKKGKAELLVESLEKLQELLPFLENITTPTYSVDQEKNAKELAKLIHTLIFLPEHIELSIQELEKKCRQFLHTINPFFIQTIESTGLRKARLIEEIMTFEEIMENMIENYQTHQKSPHLILTMLEELIEAMSFIDRADFSKEEQTDFDQLVTIFDKFSQNPSEKQAIEVLTKAISLENLLRNHMSFKDALEILDQGVKQAFSSIENKETKSTRDLLETEHVKDALFLLSKYTFTEDHLNFSIDEMFRQYKNLLDAHESDKGNLDQIILHLQTFSRHLDIVKTAFSSVEGLIEIDQSAFLEDDEDY